MAVTGADGLLGADLVLTLESLGHDVVPTGSTAPDIRWLDDVRDSIVPFQPDWVFHLAAFARVDDCESKPEFAFEVNALGAANVAQVAAEVEAGIVYISTDYVFDGESRRPYSEGDPTRPLSVYGKSKLQGELEVRKANPRHLIVRTSWLYGRMGHCFPKTILNRIRLGAPLRVVNDQRGAPTWTLDLCEGLLRLVASESIGTYHCTAMGECTWHDFATRIVRRVGVHVEVEAIDSETFGARAPRPKYSLLSNRRFQEATGWNMPDWKSSADRFLDEVLTENSAP